MATQSAEARTYHPWTTYMWASEEARRRGDRRAGTDHLLLGLLEEPEIEAVLGVSLLKARDRLDSLDREVLGALGVAQGIGRAATTDASSSKEANHQGCRPRSNSDDSGSEASTPRCGKARATWQGHHSSASASSGSRSGIT